MKSQLFDPYSGHIEFLGQPMRSAVKNPTTGQWEAAWFVSMLVNAKNRFGAYVGSRPVHVFMRGTRVVQTLGLQDCLSL
jgi:hypothetical protein